MGKVNYKSFVGTGLVPVRKTFAKPMSGGQGCFRNKVKVTIRCTPARARGTPGEGSPRQNSPPDCFASPPALSCRKEFRPVRRATKGAAFGLRRLLKKAGENFNVCFDNFCGVGALCPPAKSQQSCFRVEKEKVKSHYLRVFAVRQRAPRFTARWHAHKKGTGVCPFLFSFLIYFFPLIASQ